MTRYRAEIGEIYYVILPGYKEVEEKIENRDFYDNLFFSAGIYFRTREEAVMANETFLALYVEHKKHYSKLEFDYRAPIDEPYFTVSASFTDFVVIQKKKDDHSTSATLDFCKGNYFRTLPEANSFSRKFKELWKELISEDGFSRIYLDDNGNLFYDDVLDIDEYKKINREINKLILDELARFKEKHLGRGTKGGEQ